MSKKIILFVVAIIVLGGVAYWQYAKIRDNTGLGCAKEGESPTYFDLTTGKINPEGKQCCSGLKEIRIKTSQADLDKGICLTIAGSSGVCSSCGNGVCESNYEDKCNCPEDCK